MPRHFSLPLRFLILLILLAIGASAFAGVTPQTITFGGQTGKTYGAAPFALNPLATSTSGLTPTYTSTTLTVCTITGTTVTILTAGTCTIAADQAGDGTYAAALQVTQNIVISKANQTIAFSAQGGQLFTATAFLVNPLASASSALAVAYSSTTPLVCTIAGTNVTIVAAGTCTIAANQAGDGNYNAATQVTQNIAISPGSQTITFGAQAGQSYSPAATFALNPMASADSGLAVTYTSTTLTVCTITGSTVTILTAGTCTIAANQAGSGNYNGAPQVTRSIAIAKAAQTITFGVQGGQTYGVVPFALASPATSDSGLAVTYSSATTLVCTISGSTVTIVSVGTCTIAANQAGNVNYNAAPQVTSNIVVSQAAQTITFGVQAAKSFNSPPFLLSPLATTTSGLALTYTSTTPMICSITGSTVTIVAPGTCTIAADQAGNGNYTAAVQVTSSIVINQATQTITFGAQTAKAFGAAPFLLSPLATASSALAVTYTSTTPLICTILGSTVTIVTPGTCTIAADQAGNANYAAAPQVTQNIVLSKGNQTITFAAQGGQSYNSATFALNPLATASSGLAVAYSSTTLAICTIAGTTVTIVTPGTCVIAVNQAGDTSYNAAPQVTQNIVIAKGIQTLTFAAQTGQVYGAAPFPVNPLATSTSGLTPTYTSATLPVCTVNGSTVTIVAAGTCTIAANQAGDAIYSPATQVAQSFLISQASQTITFGAQTAVNFGATPFALNPLATASSALPVTYTSTTASVCTISGSTVTILTAGTCTIAANQAGNAAYAAAAQATQNITVNPSSQTITFGAQAGKAFGAAPFLLSPLATASSKLAVTYTSTTASVCTISGNTVTIVAVGTCTIAADQGGNAAYAAAAQVTQNITISQASQTITFGTQAGKVYGAAPFQLSPLATASSALAVIYTSTTASVCTVSGTTVTLLSAGTCTIAANQMGNANYSAATQVTQNITIAKGTQTITFGTQGAQFLGVAPFALSPAASASSGLALTYSSTTATVCTITGTTVTALKVGTCTISAAQAGDGNYAAATAVSQSITIASPSVPGKPSISNAIAGFGSATVSFSAPASDGGSTITAYTATCVASGQTTRTGTSSGRASSIIVSGMTLNVSYACSVTASNSMGNSPASDSLAVTPSTTYVVPTTASSSLTGLWWNPAESGWGMSIIQHDTTNFVGWFTYDASGAPTWYVMSSCPIIGNACSGDIYAVKRGTSFVTTWDASSFSLPIKVGTGILTFVNASTGVFNFSIDGVLSSKSITRQIFAAGSVLPATDYSDLWWNPSESGWGVSISQQYGTIFATMFGYDDTGKPIWYVASNCAVYGNSCSGELYQVASGTPPTTTWMGIGGVSKVGFIELVFTDSANGSMNYFINGVPGSKAITRQLF